MKLGLAIPQDLLTPDNFRFAKQAGCTQVFVGFGKITVETYPPEVPGGMERRVAYSQPNEEAWTYEGMCKMRDMINDAGLEWEAIQSFEVTHWYDVLLDGPRKAEQMDKLGMEVVEVDLRDAYAFGGGLHCCTADVYREGKKEDYFPVQ